jgi:ribosomal protein S18 acetylase RimI-like enzyme
MFAYRRANISDVGRITEFNCRLALETEGKQLDTATVTRGVSRGLLLAPEVLYFVAEKDGVVIGQVMLTREWSDWRDGWMLWIQSVYVDAEWRGLGVFGKLFSFAIESAASEGHVVNVRLYVEHANEAAKAVYGKLGFRNAGYEVMEMPYQGL